MWLYGTVGDKLKTDDYGKLLFWGSYLLLKPIYAWPEEKYSSKKILAFVVEFTTLLFLSLGLVFYTYENKDNFNKFSNAICILNIPITESKKLLEESIDLLKHEPDALLEGNIRNQAVSNLKELELVLQTVHKAMGDTPA